MSEAVDLKPRKSGSASKQRSKTDRSGKKRAKKVAALKTSRPKSVAIDAAPRDGASGWRGVGVGVLLLLVCVGLGVQVASQSQRMRALYSELQQDQEAKDALLAERSRLLLELGARNNYSGAEAIAREQLDMRFPESITRVEANADDGSLQRLVGPRGRR